MKKILIAILIVFFLSVSGLNAVSIESSNFQPNNLAGLPSPNDLPEVQKTVEGNNLDNFGLNIDTDDEWLFYPGEIKKSSEKLFVTFDPPTIEVNNDYCDIFVPECTYTAPGGAPLLPHRTITLTFQPGTKIVDVTLKSVQIEYSSVIKPVRPEPEPLPVTNSYDIYSNQFEQEPAMDPNVYSEDQLFPEKWLEYSTGMGLNPMTDDRTLFLVVHVFPVRYNPIQASLVYLTSCELEVHMDKLEPEPASTQKTQTTEPNSRGSDGDGGNSGARAESHDMVIIAPTSFQSYLTDFALHKTGTGIDTEIITMADITTSRFFPVTGRDDAEKIKYFIFNAVKTWDIKYVLLAGDADRIPTRITHVDEQGLNDDEASDLYFADVFDSSNNFCNWDFDADSRFGEYSNGNIDRADLYPDVHIGRIPASSSSELTTMLDKTKNYEIDTIGQPWFKNAILCGLDTFSGGTPEGEYLSDHIASNYLQDFNVIKLYESDNSLSTTNIRSNWNNGAGFVSFSDHGLHSSWGGEFSSSDVRGLTNGKKVAFVNFDACLTGEFDQGSDCIAEETILTGNGGGVAVVAASRIAYGSWGRSHINSVSGYLNVRLYHNFKHTTEIAGAMLSWAKIDYIRNVGSNGATNFKTLVEYNYFGDPSVLLGGLPTAIYNLKCDNNQSSVKPGESTEYRIQVENTDIQTRQIKLSITGVPDKWTAKLSDSSLTLQPGSDTNVTLTVTSPEDCLANFEANIKFIGALANSERTICIDTKTKVLRIFGLEIHSDGKPNATGSVYPGREINFTLMVCNLGNALDQITLDLIDNQYEIQDWGYEFSEKIVTLDPFCENEIKLTIDVPSFTVAKNYTPKVTGRLLGNSKTEEFELFIEVIRVYGMNLTCSNQNQSTDPGYALTYKLQLENEGNHLEYFELYIPDLPDDWEVQFKIGEVMNDTIMMEPFSLVSVKCIITVPLGTLMDEYKMMLVSRCIGMEFDVYSNLMLKVNVNRVYGIAISSEISNISLDPGKLDYVYIEVDNLGNYYDYANLEVASKPDNWVVTFEMYNNIPLSPNGYRSIKVGIQPSEMALVGAYNVYVRAILVGDHSSEELQIVVNVNRIYNLSIENVDSSAPIKPGLSTFLQIRVTNLGNAGELVTLSIPNQLHDSNLVLQDYGPLKLQAYGSKDIDATLEVDEYAIAGLHSIPIVGKLESNDEKYSSNFEFNIDLTRGIELGAAKSLIETEPGEEIRFYISVHNTGNSQDEFNLIVSGVPDSWVVKFPLSRKIVVDPFSFKNQTLTFVIPSDEPYHDVELEVRIQSRTDQKTNTILPIKVSVVEDKFTILGMEVQTFTISILLIIIIIILVGLSIFSIKRRKKTHGRGGDENIIQYTSGNQTIGSDGSRIEWEETQEPLPAQYNPPTPAPYGQPFDLEIQAPEPYHSRANYQSYNQYQIQPMQHEVYPQMPPPMPMPQKINDPLLPPASDDLIYNLPNDPEQFQEVDIPVEPELDFEEPRVGVLPGTLPVEVTDIEAEEADSVPLEEISVEEQEPEYHQPDDLSLDFKPPKGKKPAQEQVKSKDDDIKIELEETGEEVKLFKPENELSFKRPKQYNKTK